LALFGRQSNKIQSVCDKIPVICDSRCKRCNVKWVTDCPWGQILAENALFTGVLIFDVC